jgi:hypothetical protein
VAALVVPLGHHIEEERVDVVVERLVVEEELGEQAEVLAKGARARAVDLEDGDVAAPVDLVARRVHLRTPPPRQPHARGAMGMCRAPSGAAAARTS